MSYESIRDLVYRAETLEREIEAAKSAINYDEVVKEIDRIKGLEKSLDEAKEAISPVGKKVPRKTPKKQAAKNAVQDAVLSTMKATLGLVTSGQVLASLGPNYSSSSVKAALRRLANAKEISRRGKLGYYYGELPSPQPELAGPEPEA